MKIKIERKKNFKETIKFNLILSFILAFLPFLFFLFLIRVPLKEIYHTKIIYINLISFFSIILTSSLEFISRKNTQINGLLYVIYWASILFGFLVFMYYLFFVLLSLFAIIFPLKWG